MPRQDSLIFVYNADRGLFNTLADIGHKIFSPETYSCSLCALTHGYFQERKSWREFVQTLPLPCHFLHRDEFHQRYPDRQDKLPAVFLAQPQGLRRCISAQQLESCDNIDLLQQMIISACIKNGED